jgi:hypothetical protein
VAVFVRLTSGQGKTDVAYVDLAEVYMVGEKATEAGVREIDVSFKNGKSHVFRGTLADQFLAAIRNYAELD